MFSPAMESSSYMFSSILSSLMYMMREPNFSWTRALPYILPLCIPLLYQLPGMEYIKDRWHMVWNGCRRKNVLEFTAHLRLRNWSEEPDSVVRNFSLVLWEWNRKNLTVNCKSLMEEGVTRRFYESDDNSYPHRSCPLFVDDALNPFWNKDMPDIHYRMWMERNTDREGVTHPEVILRMSFHNKTCTPNTVVHHIEYIKTEAERIHSERSRKQRVLVSTDKVPEGRERAGGGPDFMTYEFATTSSFANFFSEEATAVDDDLTYFLTNKGAYQRTGRPWTYTVLNEGQPGVGKTKLVKAIAAKTGHTLIIINLSHITSIQTLYEAFHSPVLAGEYVPHDKRLYYIPEVDTQLFDMLKARQAGAVATTVPAVTDKPAAAAKSFGADTATSKKPTLGEILNILDGVPERHGHILILDTNHLSALDPALIRPGRVDRIVSWQKMSGESMRRFIENYYMREMPKSVVFPDKMLTAAELQGLVGRYKDWETLLPALITEPQKLKARRSPRLSTRQTKLSPLPSQ